MSGSFDRVMEGRKELVNRIIENMEKGYILPKPQWGVSPFTFQNPISHAKYHGANMIKLYLHSAVNGYTDTRFMTYKQAQSIGWRVKKGEKGIRLEKFIFTKQVEQENPDTGQMEKVMVRLKRPMVNTFVVFNASQIEGIEPQEEMKPLEHNEVLELADQLIASSECTIREEPWGKAYYRPASDTIVLPPRDAFISQEAFATTLMHEMVHSTGHPSRLNRPLLSCFGTQEYALEELRAELGAFFMGTDLGIEGSQELLDSHTHYLESWIKVLKDDPNELFRACSDAQRAVERLSSNLERYQELCREKETVHEPVKMDLNEYLAKKGLSFISSDYMLDKMKLPKGETMRQRQQRLKEADRVENDYQNRRSEAIKEYYEKVKSGELIPKTKEEHTLEAAQGHPDNASTQAARRMLVKRGIMSESELAEKITEWDANVSQWDAAIEEALEAVEAAEPELEMEM
jgi:antirestriction protein ArdC